MLLLITISMLTKQSKEKLKINCSPTIEPFWFQTQEDANPENSVVEVPEREDKSHTDDYILKNI